MTKELLGLVALFSAGSFVYLSCYDPIVPYRYENTIQVSENETQLLIKKEELRKKKELENILKNAKLVDTTVTEDSGTVVSDSSETLDSKHLSNDSKLLDNSVESEAKKIEPDSNIDPYKRDPYKPDDFANTKTINRETVKPRSNLSSKLRNASDADLLSEDLAKSKKFVYYPEDSIVALNKNNSENIEFRGIRKNDGIVLGTNLSEIVNDYLTSYLGNAKKDCSVYIKNLRTGETVSINSKTVHESASLLKLYVAGAVENEISKGNFSNKTQVQISKSDLVPLSSGLYSKIVKSFKRNKRFPSYSIEDLMDNMLSVSGNTETNALIRKLGNGNLNSGIDKVNLYLKNIQINDRLESGVDKNYRLIKQNKTSAKEMGNFMELLYSNKVPGSKKILHYIESSKETNKRIGKYIPENDAKIFHKSGYLNNNIHSVALIKFNDSDSYIVSVLQGYDSSSLKRVKNSSENDAREVIGKLGYIVYQYDKLSK